LGKNYKVIDHEIKYYGNWKKLYIREDVPNKRIYYFDESLDKTSERLLLDFNVYEGDSMLIGDRLGVLKAKLIKKEKIFLLGKNRTKYYLGQCRYITIYEILPSSDVFMQGNYLIEGVGSRAGLDITEFYAIIEGSNTNVLRCYNKETIERTAYDCNMLMSAEAKTTVNKNFEIYPNPATDQIHIDNFESSIRFAIYQSTGQKVLDRIENQNIDVSTLPNGLYLLEAIDKDGRRYIQKWEKQ
jgi:hypothetical protein